MVQASVQALFLVALLILCPFFAQAADKEDEVLTVPQLIAKNHYSWEEHKVVTSDGYILTLHRIPRGKNANIHNGKVVFLQHGVLSSSADWIIPGPGKCLGYNLADVGYDVWMGNARGNTQSRKHTSLSPDKNASAFWNFSWHEIGNIDLPAMIDYILLTTNKTQLDYIGHSQGTTVFYVMATMKPEYNAKINVHISLAPIAFMNHMTSPLLKIVAMWTEPLDHLTELIGLHEFLPSNKFLTMGGNLLCGKEAVTKALCKNAVFAICGFSPKEMNATLLPIMTGHSPAGSSMKQIVHYGQEIKSGHFRQYDHGPGNVKRYGSTSPPDYDLKKISAPGYIFYSRNDWLSHAVDVKKLYELMSNVRGTFLVADGAFNHMDYLVGIHAPELVYGKVIRILDRH